MNQGKLGTSVWIHFCLIAKDFPPGTSPLAAFYWEAVALLHFTSLQPAFFTLPVWIFISWILWCHFCSVSFRWSMFFSSMFFSFLKEGIWKISTFSTWGLKMSLFCSHSWWRVGVSNFRLKIIYLRILKTWLHCVLVFSGVIEKSRPFWFLVIYMTYFADLCWKHCPFSIEVSWHACWKSIDHACDNLFLSSLFYSFGLSVFPYAEYPTILKLC